MQLHVVKEIEYIREMIISMATIAEEAVRDSVSAFLSLDSENAKKVIGRDCEINSLEMNIDKEIFECLALKAPVAGDLRFLFSMQKINKDLERIGDHAVNIAQSALNCIGFGNSMATSEVELMSTLTRGMLSDTVNSFIKSDTQLALMVLKHDDKVDELNRIMSRQVIEIIRKDINTIESALELLRVSKNLERIADLSTNIAEDVIFHANAKDIKHHSGENSKAEKSSIE
ncbi:MAG: phosphate signaling complex protein PhoU [Fibrobacter sp.]|nr:phosphate signaling complex protein PhoU [Fibrobacter sp.]